MHDPKFDIPPHDLLMCLRMRALFIHPVDAPLFVEFPEFGGAGGHGGEGGEDAGEVGEVGDLRDGG